MQAPIPRIGLTGGIGSGKSTVAQMLVARGAYLIDADAIARAVTLPGGAAIAPIAASFGAEYIAADGSLDRARMRQHVFAHPEAKQQIEAIIHPLVAQEGQRLAQLGIDAGAVALIYDIPLLVESGRWRKQLDAVWVAGVHTLAHPMIALADQRAHLDEPLAQYRQLLDGVHLPREVIQAYRMRG